MPDEVVLEVFSPESDTRVDKIVGAPRFTSLDGKRVGLIFNEKPQGDVLLERTAELMKERFRDVQVTWFSRQCCQPPPEGYIEAAVKGSDVAVGAAGD